MTNNSLEILGMYGKEEIAILYIGKYGDNVLEFVESVQPPVPRDEKWVLIISTLFGCPMRCVMCDSGEYYHGIISKEGMIAQIDHMVTKRFPDRKIPIPKFKIQFARMGEPSINPEVIDLLQELPKLYEAPGLMPCISTVAPKRASEFFEKLISLKNSFYSNGNFQLQISLHSSDPKTRKKWIPQQIWSFKEISSYGDRWFEQGDRLITLNFAVAEDSIIDPKTIRKYFDPSIYLIKLTPINPTNNAIRNKMNSLITEENQGDLAIAKEFRDEGFETVISIGEWEENRIGTNCGQLASHYENGQVKFKSNYTCQDFQII